MRVRKLDSNNDMTFGQGLDNFWINDPAGVAQVIVSRLMLWQGEWYLDLNDGTPYQTQVLGKYTGSTRDATMAARIVQTDGVLELVSFYSQVTRDTRMYSIQADVNTAYGLAALYTPPILELGQI